MRKRCSCFSIFLAVLGLTLSAAAFAHASLVLGRLEAKPDAPQAGEGFELSLTMTDPTGLPIEDAVVVAEFERTGVAILSTPLAETDLRGVYTAQVALPKVGDYTLVLRDQTFRQEEVRVSLAVTLGDSLLFPEGENSVIFPPTATASAGGLRNWLIWVIVLPVVVGIVVTVLVLRSSPRQAEKD